MTIRIRTFFAASATVVLMTAILVTHVSAQAVPGCTPACTFDLSYYPRGIAVSPDGQYLFVGGSDATVQKIRLSDHSVMCTTPSLGIYDVWDVAITPDGQYVLAGNTGSGYSSTIINAETCEVVCDIPGGTDPAVIDITPDGSTACIANHWSGFMQLVSVETCAEIGRVNGVGNGAWDVEITPDGNFAYVMLRADGPSPGNPYVLKVDLSLQSIVDTIIVYGFDLGLTPDGMELWVTGKTRPFAYVISTDNDSLIDSVAIPYTPADCRIEISPDGEFAYISQPADSALAVISVLDRSYQGVMPTGRGPRWIALSPDGVRIFISNQDSECMTEYTSTSICAVSYTSMCCPINGDVDWNGLSTPLDVTWLVNHVYKSQPLPECPY